MFLVYPFLAVLSLVFAALAMAYAPWLALAADADGNLPHWLSWFQTFDASLDAGWRDGYFAHDDTPTGWRLWWLRTRWLWRNPGYTFDSQVLGCAFDPLQWRVIVDREEVGRVTFVAFGPAGRFNVYLQRGNLYVKLGWKAWNNWGSSDWKTPEQRWARLPICCSVKI